MALKEGLDFEEKFASTIEMDKIKVVLALEIKIKSLYFFNDFINRKYMGNNTYKKCH